MLAFSGAVRVVTRAAADAPGKKGFGGWDRAQREKLDARWYYNWMPQPDTDAGSAEFVPMVKGENFEWQFSEAKKFIKAGAPLLCLNEPERADQGRMSVRRALEIWPQLMATGARLSSPAPSSDRKGIAWLKRFMTGVQARGLRVDFIAVHWYRSNAPAAFEAFLKELHEKYRRPIWVTEFNAGEMGDEEAHQRFLRGALHILEELPFVERYSFFTPSPGEDASLFQADGTLSKLGELYRRAH